MANDIVVRVGGALDRSFDAVWDHAERRARRAYEVGRGEGQKALASSKADANAQVLTSKQLAAQQMAIAKAQFSEASKLNRAMAVEQLRTDRALALQQAQISRERTKTRLSAIATEEKAEAQYAARLQRMKLNSARESNRIQRQAEREHLREQYAQSREIDRFATRTSHRATRFFFPRPEGALGYGKRLAMDLARGAGIDTTLSGGVSRARELEQQAYFLSSKGYFAGEKGPAGVRVAPKQLMTEARDVATKQAFEPAKVLEAQAAYVGLTGDLATARALMTDLAALSGATGSEMLDLGRAAGAMGNAIGEGSAVGDEKARVLMGVMRVLASQGKLTAIEMDSLAKHMPKLAGASRMYADVPRTMAEFGALGQLSMGGGAWNAASATTAMAGFTAEISSAKGARAFKALGVERYDPKTKMLRSPIDIIKEAIEKTGGSPEKISKLVTGTRGGRMVNWLASEYRRTGSFESTDKRIGALMNAGTLSPENIKEINDKRMETLASKAQQFQNNLDLITESLASRLLPTLEQLAPKLLQVASTFSDIVAWAAANPWKAVLAGVGVSITRALAESGGRLLLERGLNGISGAGGMTAPLGAITGAGAVTSLLGAIALGAATFTITSAVLNASTVSMQEAKAGRAANYNQIFQEFAKGYGEAKTPEERAEVIKRAKENADFTHESRGKLLNSFSTDDDWEATKAAMSRFVKTADTSGETPWAPGDLAPSKPKQAATAEEIGNNVAIALGRGELRVRITNPEEIKAEGAKELSGGGGTGMPVFDQW